MKVLVTGVGGYIGQNLAALLNEKGYCVTGIDKADNSDPGLLSNLAEFQVIDLSNDENINKCCKDIEIVVHLAGVASVQSNSKNYRNDNVEASKNILSSALKNKVKKFIFLSSEKAAKGKSKYAVSKLSVEKYILNKVEDEIMDFTILRSSLVYGKGMKSNIVTWLNRVLNSSIKAMPESRSSLSMIGVEDLCRIIEKCICDDKTSNKIYTVSDGYSYGINEIEKTAREVFKKNATDNYPQWMIYLGARFGDFLSLIGLNFPLNSNAYKMFFHNKAVHDDTFFNDTGFKPRQNFLNEIPIIFSD